MDPRERFEAGGRIVETLPDATELVCTDVGDLFAPAEAA